MRLVGAGGLSRTEEVYVLWSAIHFPKQFVSHLDRYNMVGFVESPHIKEALKRLYEADSLWEALSLLNPTAAAIVFVLAICDPKKAGPTPVPFCW